MRITDVLRRKGDKVVTISPEETVTTLLAELAKYGVGALVVSRGDGTVEGIVSERDVVRRLHAEGAALLQKKISSIMTEDVHTCGMQDSVDHLMATMTQHRFRHVPVLVEDRLAGIVSIGDVVKTRLDELEAERDQLAAYIST